MIGMPALFAFWIARHQRLVVDRHEHERVGLLDDPVLDEAGLLLDVVGLGRRDDLEVDVELLGRLLRADAAGLSRTGW